MDQDRQDAEVETHEDALLEAEAGTEAPPAKQSPEDNLAILEAEARDLRDRLARARADYDNLQKRQARDAALERDRVKARFLEGFLQVFEYATMAEVEAERTPGPLAQGVKMVVQQFRQLLQDEGVQTVGSVGDAFDPSRHEAVAEEPVDGVEPGRVSRVVRTGYLLGDRVLRYAQVAVAPAADSEE